MINLKIVCSSDELKVTQARAKAAESKIIVQRRLSFGQIQQFCLLRGRMMASRANRLRIYSCSSYIAAIDLGIPFGNHYVDHEST